MKTNRISYLSLTALMLCTVPLCNQTATACPVDFSGSTTFTAGPGSSQTHTWTVSGLFGGSTSFTITSGTDVFTISPVSSSPSSDSGTFTITFNPGPNATGTFKGTMTCPCNRTIELVGTVAASGVANSLPSNVTFTITPNPATDNVNILSNNVRSAEIGIYDLLGKEITSSKTTAWKLDASNIAAGSYFIRMVGESNSAEHFAIWRRIIIAR